MGQHSEDEAGPEVTEKTQEAHICVYIRILHGHQQTEKADAPLDSPHNPSHCSRRLVGLLSLLTGDLVVPGPDRTPWWDPGHDVPRMQTL